MTEESFIPYCAGFIDGEGSFTISILRPTPNNRRRYTFYIYKLTVVNTVKSVLEEMQTFFGGKVSARKEHPNRKQCYQWALHGKNLVNLCTLISPYSRVKKEHINIILKFSKTIDGRRNTVSEHTRKLRECFYEKIKSLNQTGPKI